MTPVNIETLTDDDRAEIDRRLADYAGYGWTPVESAQGRTRRYTPGLRIRHVGQQYFEAYEHGTGIIVAVLMRNEAIELVVAYDEPRFEGLSRITVLGSYHVDLGPFAEVAR